MFSTAFLTSILTVRCFIDKDKTSSFAVLANLLLSRIKMTAKAEKNKRFQREVNRDVLIEIFRDVLDIMINLIVLYRLLIENKSRTKKKPRRRNKRSKHKR